MKSVRHKRAVITLSVLAVIAVSAIIAVHQFLQPVSATQFTTIGNPTAQTSAQPATPATTPVTGTYADFAYPADMQPMKTDGPAGSELAVYSYKKADTVPWQLSISVIGLHGPYLNEDSDYVMRKENPTRYQMDTATYGSNTFTVFSDTQAGNFAEVAFALHGSTSVDISLTGDSNSGDTALSQAFQQVLASWQWK